MRFFTTSAKQLLIPILFFACSPGTKTPEPASESAAINEKRTGVCVWDGASVRENPDKKGKWLSAVALGEMVTMKGEAVIDSADKNTPYFPVELSDGKTGFMNGYTLEPDAIPGAVLFDIKLYRRPDLLTVTETGLTRGEIVAVRKTENGWSDVVGAEKKKQGWIQESGLSYQAVDLAVALMIRKAKVEPDSLKREKLLDDIRMNKAFSGSAFLSDLMEPAAEPITEQEEEVYD